MNENQLIGLAIVVVLVLALGWAVNVAFTLARIERNTRWRR